MDIKHAHMLVNNLISISEDDEAREGDLYWYLRSLKPDIKDDYKPTKAECFEHLELKIDEEIRQWESVRTRIKNYYEGLAK